MTKAIVSVDWDFFVPEDPRWDFGHQEALLFLNLMWLHRGMFVDLMKTDGKEATFWADLRSMVGQVTEWIPLHVSDSHAYAVPAFSGSEATLLLLFDAHHDAWEIDDSGDVMCHNWVRFWLEQDDRREVIWVKPDSSLYEPPADLSDRIQLRSASQTFSTRWEGIEVDSVHVCRSGCWCPPWLDTAFVDFIKASKLPYHTMQDGEWDPMQDRWTEEMQEQTLALQQQWEAFKQEKGI